MGQGNAKPADEQGKANATTQGPYKSALVHDPTG
jgi:hypothetical protein